MRVTLVQPPSNRADTSELAPPLSLLTVAAVLRDDDVDVTMVDLNLECLQTPARAASSFYDWATARITQTSPDVVGFTSMALESHVCLELARRLKTLDGPVHILLGGPHFSTIAPAVLRLYPWVDVVVVGEGELAARAVLRAYRRGRSLLGINNVVTLDRDEVRLERVFKPSRSLDAIPFPAYELVNLESYYDLNPYRVLDFEHARGCALRCSFCYSPAHWGQGEQARTIERIVDDICRHYELGARHLFFVGDNFLNSKAFAQRLCQAIAANNPGITWRCYATLQQLTEPVVDALASAQCKYVFVGVDAVSKRTKEQFRKTYFRGWPALKQTLERSIRRGVVPTCAFMVHPSSSPESVADTEEALQMAVRVHNLGCGVRLNPLTIYAHTGIAKSATDPVNYSNAKPRILLDGHWMTEHNNYARERPSLFPFHSTVGPPEHYESFVRSTHAGFTLLDHFSHTLLQANHAGRALGELLRKTAGGVDYDGLVKNAWKAHEADAFAKVITDSCATTEMQDTLAFELAEFRLRRKRVAMPVSIEVDGMRLEACLLPHAEVDLRRTPDAYETTDPPQSSANSQIRSFVVVPGETGMRYLAPMNGALRVLRKIKMAARDGQTASVPAASIAHLVAAKVLALPSDHYKKSTNGVLP